MYILRELERDDLKSINIWRNDKALIDFLGAPYRYINLDVENDWYEDYLENRHKAIRCVIVEPENRDKALGIISLTDIDYTNRSGTLHIMIGDVQNRGKGIGYFSTMEILNHAFNNLNLNRVELTVLSDNKHSLNLCEKVGFKKEGVQRSSIYKNGEFKDMVMLSMLKEEFERLSELS